MKTRILFVHGYSVTNLDTYGELPLRMKAEAKARNQDLTIEEIFLGRYISFDDEVRLDDISRAFNTAIKEKLDGITDRFICITHSTGGPVIRNWWNIYYNNNPESCPLSHLIMLAPANYGSALAQLGKGTLSRLKAWGMGVEPGQNVLNWLELGSTEAWDLNKNWIENGDNQISNSGVFPFVLTGQSINRSIVDHLNTYTSELGSDGVVRSAATNLQGRYILLSQQIPKQDKKGNYLKSELKETYYKEAVATPFRIISGKSHSGDKMGIMKGIKKDLNDLNNAETMNAIFDCIQVKSKAEYELLVKKFALETAQVQFLEKKENEKKVLKDRVFIHDRYSMVIFRITDNANRPVTDFDLILTAGKNSDPNHLPKGFCLDRQRNRLNKNVITYYFNYDIMMGDEEVILNGDVVRNKIAGAKMLGLQLRLRPDSGFVQYVPCEINATADMLRKAMLPNGTTLIDICVQRIVDKQVFRLEKLVGDTMPTKKAGDFKNTAPLKEQVDM